MIGPLVKEPGWVTQCDSSESTEVGGGYARERDAILPAWDAATLARKARREE
jgi:hypothetical protein